jgi:DNA-binding transcriptional LysR family regulator
MSSPDLNLLATLDVLLTEGNVGRAAERLGLSPSAMSRALARLRQATGDPLLVRAGRGLVPTPRAIELRERVGQLVNDVRGVLQPIDAPDLAQLTRSFTLRASDGFVENFGPALISRVNREAPRVHLRFLSKPNRESTPLRDGSVDLETGVVGTMTSPEIIMQALFRDRFVGVVRVGHALSSGKMTPACYATGKHVVELQHERDGPIDVALKHLGLEREIMVVVGGFSTALAVARNSDLVATVPERHTGNLRAGMHTFAIPFPVPEITVSLLWHPRLDADPAHRWLRSCVREVCNGGFNKL